MSSFKDIDSSETYYRKCFSIFEILRKEDRNAQGKTTNDMGRRVVFSLLVTKQRGCAAQKVFEVLAATKGRHWTSPILNFCRALRTLQTKTHAEHWQPEGLEIWGVCHPSSVLRHLGHQISRKPLLTAQMSALTPLAAEQAPFSSLNRKASVPPRKNTSYLDFYHLASSQEVGKGRGEK